MCVATGSEHHLIVQIHSASAVLLKTIVHILKAVRRDVEIIDDCYKSTIIQDIWCCFQKLLFRLLKG